MYLQALQLPQPAATAPSFNCAVSNPLAPTASSVQFQILQLLPHWLIAYLPS